ncbi:3988_t:CDS:2 [Funneliformis mosseae]|uniref:3988_t:CDS:1 n=1 Tax=Funneliformis mosseae TaxID=27381 RepID=A0A9N9AWW0_FUNMO|nr:3988_t:CDS:2 [Funneliformis mosseae]
MLGLEVDNNSTLLQEFDLKNVKSSTHKDEDDKMESYCEEKDDLIDTDKRDISKQQPSVISCVIIDNIQDTIKRCN